MKIRLIISKCLGLEHLRSVTKECWSSRSSKVGIGQTVISLLRSVNQFTAMNEQAEIVPNIQQVTVHQKMAALILLVSVVQAQNVKEEELLLIETTITCKQFHQGTNENTSNQNKSIKPQDNYQHNKFQYNKCHNNKCNSHPNLIWKKMPHLK